MKIKSLFIVLASSVLLAGCSFEDIFSKLATTEVEQGANQAYTQSKINEAKQATIATKKQQFSEVAELKNVSETANFIAYGFRRKNDKTTQIDVEGTLSSPDKQMYEVWLRGENPKDTISLGVLKFNQTDDYSLTFSTQNDVSAYKTILISRESNPDTTPETIIMTGTFSASK